MDWELFDLYVVYTGRWGGKMTNALVRILISTCTAYVLFAHLKIEARPSEPTLQDWVMPKLN